MGSCLHRFRSQFLGQVRLPASSLCKPAVEKKALSAQEMILSAVLCQQQLLKMCQHCLQPPWAIPSMWEFRSTPDLEDVVSPAITAAGVRRMAAKKHTGLQAWHIQRGQFFQTPNLNKSYNWAGKQSSSSASCQRAPHYNPSDDSKDDF